MFQVPRVMIMYDSLDGNKGKGQQIYNTFCFKAFNCQRVNQTTRPKDLAIEYLL